MHIRDTRAWLQVGEDPNIQSRPRAHGRSPECSHRLVSKRGWTTNNELWAFFYRLSNGNMLTA